MNSSTSFAKAALLSVDIDISYQLTKNNNFSG